MIDKDLLSILACPETKKDLELADEALVARVNAAISSGKLFNRCKEKVQDQVQGGLLRVGDKTAMYPIREDIPILLVDELLLIDQIRT